MRRAIREPPLVLCQRSDWFSPCRSGRRVGGSTTRCVRASERRRARNRFVPPDGPTTSSAVVAIGRDTSWQELQTDARSGKRKKALGLSLQSTTELVRAPPIPFPYRLVDGKFVFPQALQTRIDKTFADMRDVLLERLARTERKEVYVYVHGIKNSFADAAFAMAELWHFFGREGVPIFYTWPAGHPGLFIIMLQTPVNTVACSVVLVICAISRP